MWIVRDIEPRIQKSSNTRPVLVLTGARQTGKTSTLRRLFPQYEFVSLDLPTEAEQAEQQPESFLSRHPAPAIIDEAQYAPALFRHLKVAVDAQRQIFGKSRVLRATIICRARNSYLLDDGLRVLPLTEL